MKKRCRIHFGEGSLHPPPFLQANGHLHRDEANNRKYYEKNDHGTPPCGYPKNWLTIIAGKLSEGTKAVALTGSFVYTRDAPFWAGIEHWLRHIANVTTSALFKRPYVISGATFAFRRVDFEAVDGYAGLTYAADQYSLATRLSKRGRVLYASDLGPQTRPVSRCRSTPLILATFALLLAVSPVAVYAGDSCKSPGAPPAA